MPDQKTEQPEAYAVASIQLFNPIAVLPRTPDEVTEKMAVYSTYDLAKPETRGEVYDIMVQGGKKGDEFIGQEFTIEHVTIFPVTFIDKNTGEQITAPLVLLKIDTGDTLQFVSKGIWGSLLMMRACGYKPFGATPQRFKLAQISLTEGKRFYQLHRAKDKPAKK